MRDPAGQAKPMAPVFLMSPPRRDWTLRGKANFRSQQGSPADAARARAEWCQLADSIVRAGGVVVVCPPSPHENLTGMIYTAEAGEYYRAAAGGPGRFVLPNMAAPHRQGEAAWIGHFAAERLGLAVERIASVWEAQGDAIRVSEGKGVVHTHGSGPFARTAAGAYGEVAERLGGVHLALHFHADPWFHGNTFLQFFEGHGQARGQVAMVVCPEALMPGEFERLADFVARWVTQVVPISVAASLGYDTNALQVGRQVVGPATLSATTRAALEALELEFVALDLGELFLKGGGAPVCLTNRLWGMAPDDVPRAVQWQEGADIEDFTDL